MLGTWCHMIVKARVCCRLSLKLILGLLPRAPGPYPQVRWYSTPRAPTPVPSSKRRWARSPRALGFARFAEDDGKTSTEKERTRGHRSPVSGDASGAEPND